MEFARISTVKTVTFGPVLAVDGTPYTGAIAYTDAKFFKNGSDVALDSAATFTYKYQGVYALALTANDLSAVGTFEIVLNLATYAAAPVRITVLATNVYDWLFGTVAPLTTKTDMQLAADQAVNTTKVNGTAQTARDLGAMADVATSTRMASGNVTVGGYAAGQVPLQPITAGRTLAVAADGSVKAPAATIDSAGYQKFAKMQQNTAGTVWYVSPTGLGGNDGLTPWTPKAAAAPSAGDVVVFTPGLYAGQTLTSVAGVTYIGYGATLSDGGIPAGVSDLVRPASNCVYRGFTLDCSTPNSMMAAFGFNPFVSEVPPASVVNVLVEDVTITGWNDCVYWNNYRSQVVTVLDWTFRRCRIVVTGTTGGGHDTASYFGCSGKVVYDDCEFSGTDHGPQCNGAMTFIFIRPRITTLSSGITGTITATTYVYGGLVRATGTGAVDLVGPMSVSGTFYSTSSGTITLAPSDTSLAGYTAARATKLDNLDAAITTRYAGTPPTVEAIQAGLATGSDVTAAQEAIIAVLPSTAGLATDSDVTAAQEAVIAAMPDLTTAENSAASAASSAASADGKLTTLLSQTGGAGTISWNYPVTDDDSGLPIPGVRVRVTSDAAGLVELGQAWTGDDGIARFSLQAGDVYVWLDKSGYEFVNPDHEVVS